MSIKEINDRITKIASALKPKEKKIPNNIPGGPASGKTEGQFNPIALHVGAADEQKEHTTKNHYNYGMEIAADHLAKDPSYYKDDMSKENIAKAKQAIKNIKLNRSKNNI